MRYLFAFLLYFATSPAFAAEQDVQRAQFRDWQANCDRYSNCAASIAVDMDMADHLVPDYRLTVSRSAYETYWNIAFAAFIPAPAPDADMVFAIGDTKITFDADTDIAAFGALNEYYPLGGKAQSLFDKMVPGSTLTISYSDKAGTIRRATFSLSGLAAALLWIDEQQARLGSERVAFDPPSGKTRVTHRDPALLSEALLARHAASTNCEPLEDLVNADDLQSYRLDASNTLHMIPCWSGAYNFSYAIYIESPYGVEQAYFASYSDVTGWRGTAALVNAWFDPEDNTLGEFAKGRGLGDCGTSGLWQWQEWGFKLLEYRAQSECEGEPGPFPLVYQAPGYNPPDDN